MTDSMNVKELLQSVNTHQVVRVIRWYEKDGDRYVGETPIHSLTLADLQALFQQPSDNPMVESYAIAPQQVEKIQSAISAERNFAETGSPMNLDLYDYFLECDSLTPMPDYKSARIVNE